MMKWTFLVQQKLKLACMLMGVMLLVILFNLVERQNIAAMNRSLTSIYEDRLVPATAIFYLTDNLYNKRFLMEKLLSSTNEDAHNLRLNLTKHDGKIDELIHLFEKTYLVDKESVSLNEFKKQVNKCRQIEGRILNLWQQNKQEEALKLYELEGKPAVTHTIARLSELTHIQSVVGGELVDNSKGILAKSDLLSTVHLALAILIGAMIIALISASKAVSARTRDFNLN